MGVELSPGSTSLGRACVGRGRIPLYGPSIGKSIVPWHRQSRVLRGITDEDIATNDISTPTPVSTSTTPLGPITRAHARRLTHQVSSLLSLGSSYLEIGDTCTLVLLRNNGLDPKGRGIAQAGFGLQDRHDLWRLPRLHPDSVLVGWVLFGKLIKSNFQRIWNHLHICSESTAILDLLQSPFQPRCCVTLIWPNGPCIKLSPRRMRSRVGTWPQHPCGRSLTFL
jgi:hypothetical protein